MMLMMLYTTFYSFLARPGADICANGSMTPDVNALPSLARRLTLKVETFPHSERLGSHSGVPGGRYLACVAGVVVFGLQLLDYGYIPNAIPSEKGTCP